LSARSAAAAPWPPTTGELPFDLPAPELRARAERTIAEVRSEMTRLATDGAVPTVENLLEPLDALLFRLQDVSDHGGLIFSVHADAATRTAGREVSEAAERFGNEFRLDERLYARVRAVDLTGQDEATRFAVRKLLRDMRRAGVEKDPATRARLLELLNAIDRTSNEFAENIARLDRSLVLDGPARLGGLPPDYVAAHPPGPDGAIRLTTKYPDVLPILAYCDDPSVRRDVLHEFMNRAFPENETVLRELLRLRDEFARTLGYPNYAAFALETKMVGTPGAARAFIERVAAHLREPAVEDLRQFLARKRRDHPDADRLDLWDSEFFLGGGYYDGKIRTERYGVDVRTLRAFLPYERVRDGLFALCEELFDTHCERAHSAEVWHPSVEAYDVTRRGAPIGRFYLDLIPREGKFNHAACFSVRLGHGGDRYPQAALICNFLDPKVAVADVHMDWRDVVTFFHEFGHLLHALLSGQPRWFYNVSPHVEWDFIEAPSQLFEEWARDPATLARFARNPATGETIPPDVLRRLRDADAFGRPIRYLRQAGLATVSLDYYDRDPTGVELSRAFRDSWGRVVPMPLPDAYHPEAAFGHLSGYSAFYYTYLWSVVIARDLLSPFHRRGTLTDRATAERYAKEILAPGASRPAAELIRAYLGRDFSFEAFESWSLEEERSAAPPPPA
jgi:thimet oligopeptidase